MVLDGISLSIIGLSLILGIVSLIAYFLFPTEILKDGGRGSITYRHEFLILFFVIFLIQIFLLVPSQTLSQDCEIKLNSTRESYTYGDNYSSYHWDYEFDKNPSFSDVNLFHRNTTYKYSQYCFDKPDTTDGVAYVKYYSGLRYFFWVYLGIYIFAFLFIQIRNGVLRKRRGNS